MGDLTKLVYCRMQVSKLTMSVKKVLALFNGHSKPISFKSEGDEADLDALKKAVASQYQLEGKAFFFKIKDEEWQGQFVDIVAGPVPDKSVIQVQVKIEVER